MYLAPHRSEIYIDKPLPARPMPDEDPIEYSAMWSDSSSDYDSDDGSTLESFASPSSPSEPRKSVESYPIFVSSDSNDLNELDLDELDELEELEDIVDPAPTDHVNLGTSPPALDDSRTDSIDLDASSIILGANAHYGRPLQWSQHANDGNHYFRDKTWHFFPELAAPSSHALAGRANSTSASTKARKEGRLNVSARRRKWYSFDRGHAYRSHGVRDSIKTYVHKTLARDEERSKTAPRPVTAPTDPMGSSRPFPQSSDGSAPAVLEIDTRLANMSLAGLSTATYENPRASPTTPREKQPAGLTSPYPRFGPSSGEAPEKVSGRVMISPPQNATNPSLPLTASTSSPLPSPLKVHLQQNTRGAVRALQGSTIQMRHALGGAKKKERRREELKSQIRLVGTVNPHTFGKADPWSPA
ncbi:hypothetical protein N7468_009203 [Penicillium chermesinum]|uniref:Uncharacterized protein n=1 Tax=Penicillium chermesinum TaxID=63820 RepID=A0A9W9NJT7_9EURO|nr:uncharacterized protein N7468_009203 [Penicillium chermesinum]KAJ5219999.1 hypothetical protein N7468_009203 [Penicillium chermesinum]